MNLPPAFTNSIVSILLFSSSGCANRDILLEQDKPYLNFFKSTVVLKLPNVRLPTGSDLIYWGQDRSTYFYKSLDNDGNYKPPYWTKGDFNLDAVDDWVYLLFDNNSNIGHICAFLSHPNGKFEHIRIMKGGITTAVSTESENIDGREIDVLKIFEFEGHGSLWVWDDKVGSFQMLK